jgi:hypothetical protein
MRRRADREGVRERACRHNPEIACVGLVVNVLVLVLVLDLPNGERDVHHPGVVVSRRDFDIDRLQPPSGTTTPDRLSRTPASC